MTLSPNYFGNHPKCYECRSTPDSMIFSDGASPLADFWEEQERDVQVADATVPAPVIASSYAETNSAAAAAAPPAAAHAEPEENYSDDPCSRINVGGYVYILFDAASGSASIYKGKIKSYNFVIQKYTVYFSADETEYKWTVYKLASLIREAETFIKERSIPKSEIRDVLILSKWNSSERFSDSSSAGDSKDGDASGPSSVNKTDHSAKEQISKEKMTMLVGHDNMVECLSINGAMSGNGMKLLSKIISDARPTSQCVITAFENIRCNKFVLVEWKGAKKYAGKMDFISEFPNTATYVRHNKIWLERLRKIYTNWAGVTTFLTHTKRCEAFVFMGLSKISYLHGDERDYLMSYNRDDGFFYALNYYGAHRLDIYSSAEERPESDDEKRNRIERERRERERMARERMRHRRIEHERKEHERITREHKELERFEARKRERTSKDSGGAAGGRYYSNDPPKSFLCPITCDLMMDPVIACDGHSYERSAIEKWLSKSRKSPMTGLNLESTVLIPNLGLKGDISEWLDN